MLSDHLKTRLTDVATMFVAAAILFSLYTGYVLMSSVKDVFSGQCRVIQDSVLDAAVKAKISEQEKDGSSSDPAK
jgi:hypothetical protein